MAGALVPVGPAALSASARPAAPEPGVPGAELAGAAPTRAGEAGPAASPGLGWPVPASVESGFGPRAGGMHTGLDIDGETGAPVAAAGPGRVVLAGVYFGYGETVGVDHGHGVATRYGHLSAYRVAEGRRGARGDVLGLIGCTGSCTGDHLHFEVRIDEEQVDPLPYLRGRRALPDPPAPPPPAGPGDLPAGVAERGAPQPD